MKFLIIQENGRHAKNRNFRECFCMQRSLVKMGQDCDVWGLGHLNFNNPIDFNTYDVIIDLENYDSGWVPDLSSVSGYKILWSIDAHCRGLNYYVDRFNRNKCHLMLQATKDFVRKENDLWFPNCFDHTLIEPRALTKRADIGFCGNIANRKSYLELLSANFNFIADIFVIGDDMVNAINSYRIHFNKNFSNDINYRSFETIGCKIPLLTNYNSSYEDLGFKDGVNCLFYDDEQELLSKARMLLSDLALIEVIASGGHNLSSNHTYDVRANMLINYLIDRV